MRQQLAFPARPRRTGRQAPAGGEGQQAAGRGAARPSWVERPRPRAEQAASGRKDKVEPHTKPQGDGYHLGTSFASHSQIAMLAPVTPSSPRVCICKSRVVSFKHPEAEAVESCSSCKGPGVVELFPCHLPVLGLTSSLQEILLGANVISHKNQTSKSLKELKITAHSHAKHCLKCFSYIYIFDPCNNLLRKILASSSFYR